jgi:hypothetical protein
MKSCATSKRQNETHSLLSRLSILFLCYRTQYKTTDYKTWFTRRTIHGTLVPTESHFKLSKHLRSFAIYHLVNEYGSILTVQIWPYGPLNTERVLRWRLFINTDKPELTYLWKRKQLRLQTLSQLELDLSATTPTKTHDINTDAVSCRSFDVNDLPAKRPF